MSVTRDRDGGEGGSGNGEVTHLLARWAEGDRAAAITLAATLTAPPANAAYEVIEFNIDADNNPKTGRPRTR